MSGGHVKVLQLLVNYWEINSNPACLGARLDRFLSEGVTEITTFVPWQVVESDINHTLTRFLQAATDRKMRVSLIVTPEVGVHYAYSGLPKDLAQRSDILAQHASKAAVSAHLPPNSFALPSLFASDFTKRYYSFLSKLDHILADFEKNQPCKAIDNITILLSGSYWKYYRAPRNCLSKAFASAAGDFSGHASVGYRQRLEDFYAQPEFSGANPSAANRWKTQAMEEINRRWFYQQSEAVFRNRTLQFARKRVETAKLHEIELFTPEADPSIWYSYFLRAVRGEHSDFGRLSTLIDEVVSFGAAASSGVAIPHLHWSALGGFRDLTDPEKQFLILKSLLLIGGQGGGVIIDESTWFGFSKNFRTRVEAFARSIRNGDLKLTQRVLYMVSHLWSGPNGMWGELSSVVGHEAKKIASVEYALKDVRSKLLIVDPGVILTREVLQKLLQWVVVGDRQLVIPRSTLYTEKAREILEGATAGSQRIEMDLGVPYRIYPITGVNGGSKLVVYDAPEFVASRELSGEAWKGFVTSLVALSDLEAPCRGSDARIDLIPLERRDLSTGLFVLNASRQQVAVDLFFATDVSVSDLATGANEPVAPPARRFSLDVPPCAVLPLAIERVGASAPRAEQIAADSLGVLGERNLLAAAAEQLPGFNESRMEPSVWN